MTATTIVNILFVQIIETLSLFCGTEQLVDKDVCCCGWRPMTVGTEGVARAMNIKVLLHVKVNNRGQDSRLAGHFAATFPCRLVWPMRAQIGRDCIPGDEVVISGISYLSTDC